MLVSSLTKALWSLSPLNLPLFLEFARPRRRCVFFPKVIYGLVRLGIRDEWVMKIVGENGGIPMPLGCTGSYI